MCCNKRAWCWQYFTGDFKIGIVGPKYERESLSRDKTNICRSFFWFVHCCKSNKCRIHRLVVFIILDDIHFCQINDFKKCYATNLFNKLFYSIQKLGTGCMFNTLEHPTSLTCASYNSFIGERENSKIGQEPKNHLKNYTDLEFYYSIDHWIEMYFEVDMCMQHAWVNIKLINFIIYYWLIYFINNLAALQLSGNRYVHFRTEVFWNYSL